MNDDIKRSEDITPEEFKEGVQAGLSSAEDPNATPLFLRDTPEGKKGNAQDEKDETEE